MSRRNKRAIRKGVVSRAAEAFDGRARRAGSRLLPCLAFRPADGPVDAEALSRELVHLAEVARRGSSS